MSDKFNEAFGLPEDEPKPLEIIKPPEENSEADFIYARQNIYTTIELTHDALDDLAKLAKTAQNARVYEVLANLIKTNLDANKDLLELQKKRKALQEGGIPGSGPQTVNNNLFMTTAEFQEMVERTKKKIEDGDKQ